MKQIACLLIILISANAGAQLFHADDYHYTITKTNEEIIVDGKPDEPVWQSVPSASEFWEHYPVDTALAHSPISLKLVYNDQYLFIGAFFHQKEAHPVVQNLIRDDNGPFWRSDAFSVILDPTNTNQTGYYFAINAEGAKQDGIISQQGLQPMLDMYWNNAWEAEVTYDSNGYYYEFAIPFDAIKYNTDITTWGMNFIINDMQRNAFYIWTKFESSYNGLDFNYNGAMTFEAGLPKPSKKRLELKPAVSTSLEKEFDNDKGISHGMTAGLDAKYAISENINLDMALFPDFSTVEVDKQYIDFYRYEYKVPEQREFFLENNDLFSNPGSDEDLSIVSPDAYRIKPFYTRRIGIKNWQHTPITLGARLTGNITNNLRLGVLNMQVQSHEEELAQSYSAVSVRQKILKKGTISGLLLDRQSMDINNNPEELHPSHRLMKYNRSAGLELDFVNTNNTFTHSYMMHRSFHPKSKSDANFYGTDFEYRNQLLRNKTVINHIGSNYVVDMGYTPRLYHRDALADTTYRIGYTEASNYTAFLLYPNGKIRFIELSSKLNTYFHPGTGLNEIIYRLAALFENNRFATFLIGARYGKFKMLYSNDVLKNGSPLPAGAYEDMSVNMHLTTSESRSIKLLVGTEYGKFYNGRKLSTQYSIVYRAQPWGVFTMSHHLFKYHLPDLAMKNTYHLIGGRAEVNFTRDLSWTTLVQYNTQIDNINVNSLLKWRFRPLSDFYIVIKDDTDLIFNQKRLQVVAKLNYWFKI